MKQILISLYIIFGFVSCNHSENQKTEEINKNITPPKQIVVISKYAPKAYRHYIKQDSISIESEDVPGPYTTVQSPEFRYFDSQNDINTWKPKVNEIDTLIIPYYRDLLELKTRNPYTTLPNTFLVRNGDTVIIEYENKISKAKISNREVSDIELNYNNHRLSKLFGNKYSSHHKVFLGFLLSKEKPAEETTMDFYNKAIHDAEKEFSFLDSLHQVGVISNTNYAYRKDVLHVLLEQHKNNRTVNKWLDKNKLFTNREAIDTLYSLDLSLADSLMTFSHFRRYLSLISKYNLSTIEENNGNSGGFYIDSRIRFDSILKDKRFNQTIKNYLLFEAYEGIGLDFKSKDKELYLKKLQQNTTNIEKLNKLEKEYKLDFSKSDKLILTTAKNDTTTFSNVLNINKGKWLYIDFWASWCTPCRRTMPESKKLKKELGNQNVELIYLALNDKRENWTKAISADGISNCQNYFIENGNVSKVIEKLGIKTIPHYLIYNPNGELVNGFANRPGEGAKEQIQELINTSSF